ncbi:Uncharacterised protein [uncultured archaeon]|nr:Uncharacterised protein [uncultured archaeon]
MAYLVFRCSCGRHLYAQEGAKTRACPCGRRVQVNRVKILARADDARDAGDRVRKLQMGDMAMTGFHSAG